MKAQRIADKLISLNKKKTKYKYRKLKELKEAPKDKIVYDFRAI